jgi:hypothetical protein
MEQETEEQIKTGKEKQKKGGVKRIRHRGKERQQTKRNWGR